MVTSARIAHTHDGGFRSIPLDDVDPSSISIRAGIVHGEITFELRDGETLRFRRGMSLAVQEVTAAITRQGTPTPPPRAHGSGEDSHLLVNRIPPYAGLVVVPPGTQFLEITAPGRWSIVRD